MTARPASVLLSAALFLQLLAGAGAAPALADITGANTRRDDPGPWGATGASVTLRVRGYIDDLCINFPKVNGCFGGRWATTFRPEATAQSLAINSLALLHNDPLKNTVAWEVGPRSLSEPNRSQTLEPPGEPQDPCDPALPGYTVSDRWRIDIVVNHRSMIEVKNWKGSAAQVEVENQLNCYKDKAAAVGVTFATPDRSVELQNLPGGWAVPFLDQDQNVYCTWAGDLRGHIYFALMADPTLPDDVAARCGGRELQSSSVLGKWFEVMAVLTSAGLVAEKTAPVASPGRQRLVLGAPALWEVQVIKSPSTSRRLEFDFGDGTSVSLPVPSGSGVASFPLTKVFTAAGSYVQRASVTDLSVLAAQTTTADAVMVSDVPTTEAVTDVEPHRSPAMNNHVGLVKLYGNRLDSETVTVTGHEQDGSPSESGLQTVSPEVARADNESTGWFQLWTGPDPATGWQLHSGTYDVNWINVGYGDHSTLIVSCETWTVPTSTNLGTVTINTSGNITGGAGTYYVSYASNWVKFDLPTASANTGSQESGVCISDSGNHNGSQVPLRLI